MASAGLLLLATAADSGAAALSAFSERSPMGQALRHGRFGLTPDAASYAGFTLSDPESFEDYALVPGRTFDLADREAELDELHRLLFDFDVHVRLHPVGERRELTLDDAALVRYERRQGDTLTGLRLHARLPREQVLGGVTCLVRLDAHGDGRHRVPKSGDFREVLAEDLLGHWMSESSWQNVMDAARHQRAKQPEESY